MLLYPDNTKYRPIIVDEKNPVRIIGRALRLTVVFGSNGTMKSTIMGLVAQPFRTDHKDLYDHNMHTTFSNDDYH